jgi:transcriptional regulator with AAA-type ATPase domain/NAD-dependent dihydropyrimidine dehydrogenase PreA subunit
MSQSLRKLPDESFVMKRLGQYLIENEVCNEALLDNALQEQAHLKSQGIFKPLGSVLAESHKIPQRDIDKAGTLMQLSVLSSSVVFKNISRKTLLKTLTGAQFQIMPEGSELFKQGEEPNSFFIIISGKVKIFKTSTDSQEHIVVNLKNGEWFGEVSLLTGEPHSASAKTETTTSLLVFSKNNFHKLIESSPDISLSIIKGFASRLNRKDEEISKAEEKEKAYQQFVSQESELSLPDLIGQTRAINNLRKKIHDIAENDVRPVLVDGDPGTEKLVVAGTIHKNSRRASAPFLTMDADDITIEGYGAIPDSDSNSLQLEMAQSSVLFGYEKGAFSVSKTRGLGLLQICRQGTVVVRNVDKLTKGVQEKLYNYLQDKTFMTVGGQKPITSNARIIVTTSEKLEKLVSEGRFKKELLELLLTYRLTIPPIRKRKSDLRLLVDFIIIMECFKTPDRKLIKGISPEAYKRIMEYDWPGNMDELQVVIRRAINLAQGEYLIPEDIFIGIAPPKGKYTINLLKFPSIKSFFESRFYPLGLQMTTASVFSLIFIMAFLGSRSPDKNVSVLLVWAMWWPMLTVSWLVGARIWCSVCPMGAANDLLNRIGRIKFKVPSFVRDYGMHLSAIGLVVIIWAEAASKMPDSPMATGVLLLSIASFAILSGIFYERRLWCRYLCPLGRLAAIFSGCSVIEWRSNSSICNSTCKNNTCYKGDEKIKGCPLYQGPFSLRSNQNCILCGNCVKTCPNDSPALNLRMPGHELWATIKPEKVTIIFVPVILGTQLFRSIEHSKFVQALEANTHSTWLLYMLLLLVCITASYGFIQAAGRMSFDKLKNGALKKADLFTHAIIPLAFAFEFVYQLKPLLTRLGTFFPVLGRQFSINLDYLNIVASPGIVMFWQVAFLLAGIMLSFLFLQILRHRNQLKKPGSIFISSLRWAPLLFWGAIYIGIFMKG